MSDPAPDARTQDQGGSPLDLSIDPDELDDGGAQTRAGYHPEVAVRPEDGSAAPDGSGDAKGSFTVVVALAANLGVAIAKTTAALMTGSASMVAEAAHSWADTGNEILLLFADRRSVRPADRRHPMGYGREAYVWSMFAALGLFTVGAVVSISHGVSQLRSPEEGDPHYLLNYVILAIAFALEGTSFLQASRQAKVATTEFNERSRFNLHPLTFVVRSSDPTLRAVFFEDSSALIGLVLAALGIGLHQLTGIAAFDAIGSIAIGLLLGVIALFLIDRNRRFLVGQSLDPRMMATILGDLLALPEVDRVTYLHLEYIGPRQLFVVAAVDLSGNDPEARLARRLRELEARIERNGRVADAVLTLATEEEEALTPESFLAQHGAGDVPRPQDADEREIQNRAD